MAHARSSLFVGAVWAVLSIFATAQTEGCHARVPSRGHEADSLLRGIVLDGATDSAIVWAGVVILGTKIGTITRESGTFELRRSSLPDTIKVQVSEPCYDNLTADIALSKLSHPFVEFRLCRRAFGSEEILINFECPEPRDACLPYSIVRSGSKIVSRQKDSP